MNISELISNDSVSVESSASLDQVAKVMKECGVGIVSVLSDGQLIGVITYRDLVLRAMAESSGLRSLQAKDIMSSHPITVPRNGEVRSTVNLMKKHHLRHIVVSDEDRGIAGVVSIDDIWRHDPHLLDPERTSNANSLNVQMDDHPSSEGHYLG
jgi:hypothetical protein